MLDSFFSLPLRLLSALVRGRLWLVLGTVWAVFELRRLEPDSYLRKNSDNFSICKPETGESMTEENNRIIVSVDELADFFCLSRQRVSQLTAEGVLHRRSSGRGYDLKENIQDYIQNLQRRANGRRSLGEEELKKKKLEADIALKESQGELHQLKTAIASGQYISVEEVQMDYSRFFVTFKKFALNLPARIIGFVSGQLDPAESRKLEKDISQEINGMLEAFVIAGTEAKPAEPKKPKRGRPKKAPD